MNTNRKYWIDTLKLISMMFVLIHHFMLAFYCTQDTALRIGNIALPDHFLLGKTGLNLFMLISCYIFCEKASKAKISANDFVRLSIKRYIRLTVPAFISFIIIGVLYFSNLFFIKDAYPSEIPFIMSNWFAYSSNLNFIKTLAKAVIYVCFNFSAGAINPPLWCYYLFFFQPLLAFLLIQYFDDTKLLRTICILFSVFFFFIDSNWLALPLSIILFLSNKDKKSKIIAILIICLFFLMETFCRNQTGKLNLLFETTRRIMFAYGIFLFCLSSKIENTFLNKEFFSKLNNISLSVFLLHMPVICSLGYWLWTRTAIPVPVLFFIILAALIAVSFVFFELIEKKLTGFIIKSVNKIIKF